MNEELKIIIRAEMAQFKKAMNDAVSSLKNVGEEAKKSSKATKQMTQEYGELGTKIQQQTKRVRELREQFADAVVKYGKNSTEANKLGKALGKLTTKLKDNKEAYEDAMKAADKYDASVRGTMSSVEDNNLDVSIGGGKASQDIDKTNDSVQDLQGSLEAIRNLDFAGVILSAFGPELREHLSKAKAEFEEMAVHLQYGLTGLFKNGRYYKETGEEWTGLGDAIKGAFESGKLAGQTFKNGMKEVGAATSQALSGIVGILAVVIADLIVVVGLVKNALNTAKEIKAMANQASKAGMDTSTYQEWGYILKQVGIEEDKLSDFTKKLAERQNELRDGSEEAAKAFEGIGISAEEAMGSSQEELFKKTVKNLQNVENEAERTSKSFRVFTDDATDLTNLLYLTNQETQSLADNFHALGAAPSDNLIQKSKILGGSTQNLSYAWQGLKNTLTEWVIPAVIAVVQWITTAVAYINVFLQGVLGIEIGMGKAADKGNSGMKDFGTNVDKNNKKVKDLKRMLMGFDELNVLGSPNSGSDSGSSSSSGADYSSMAINPELPVVKVPDMSKFKEFMAEYGSIIQGITTWSLIAIGILLAVLGFMSGNIPLGILGISLAALGISVGAAGGEDSHWNKLGDAIMDVLRAVGDFFVSVWKKIVGVWGGVRDWFAGVWNGIKEALSPITDAIGNAFKEAWGFIKAVWDLVGPYFKAIWEGIKKVFSVVGQVLSGFFKVAWEAIKVVWSVVVGFFKIVWEGIKAVFATVKTFFEGMFRTAWEAIKVVWNAVVGWFASIWNSIAGVFSAAKHVLKGNFADAWAAIKGVVSTWKEYFAGVWAGIKSVFSSVGTWFKDTFKKAWEGVKNVFSTGGKIFTGIKDGIADVFKTVVNGIIKGINKVINVPFKAINGMLNKIRNASFLGISPFKSLWKENPLTIPQIPLLAKGGIVDSATLAMIGERGKEAVIPLENNTGWMDILADRIAGRNNTPSKIVLMLDGKELGWANINSINNITKQTGQLQLVF